LDNYRLNDVANGIIAKMRLYYIECLPLGIRGEISSILKIQIQYFLYNNFTASLCDLGAAQKKSLHLSDGICEKCLVKVFEK